MVKTLTTVASSTRESSPMVSVHIKSFCKQIPPMRRAVQVELRERITDSILLLKRIGVLDNQEKARAAQKREGIGEAEVGM